MADRKPAEIIFLSLEERICVKLQDYRELRGTLHALDGHMNMILGDVEEVVTTDKIDDETFEKIIQTTIRTIPFMFVRGDAVILVSTLQYERQNVLCTQIP